LGHVGGRPGGSERKGDFCEMESKHALGEMKNEVVKLFGGDVVGLLFGESEGGGFWRE
jgi:hypothetical protein